MFSYQKSHDTMASHSSVPFQPWLETIHTESTDHKPDINTYKEEPYYSHYNHMGYSVNQDRFTGFTPYIPALVLNSETYSPMLSNTDDFCPPEQTRPSSVLSSVSSTSTASSLTSIHTTVSDLDSSSYSNAVSTVSKNAITDGKKKSTKKGEKRADKYKRYPKPPYSFCGLIITAIENSPNKRLTLAGIHTKLMELFEFFRGPYTGWRDSVRHNLSHNACFYKVPNAFPGEDEVTGKMRCKRNFWKVNLRLAPKNVFMILQKKSSQTGRYKTYIHEELGFPEIIIPTTNPTEIPTTHIICKNETEIQEEEEHEGYQIKEHEVNKFHESFIEQPVSRPKYSMHLPHLTDCYKTNDSPEPFRRREPIVDSTPIKSEECVTSPTAKRRRLTQLNDVTDPSASGISQILAYVRSLPTEATSSTDAINNLSSLCFSPQK